MIKITDKYFIEADSSQFTLISITQEVREKTVAGKWKKGDIYTSKSVLGYFGNLNSVLRSFLNHAARDIVKGDEIKDIKYLISKFEALEKLIMEKFELKDGKYQKRL